MHLSYTLFDCICSILYIVFMQQMFHGFCSMAFDLCASFIYIKAFNSFKSFSFAQLIEYCNSSVKVRDPIH